MEPEDAKRLQSDQQVMLSYCWSDQQLVLQTRKFLQANGIRTWMDVDEMAGSTVRTHVYVCVCACACGYVCGCAHAFLLLFVFLSVYLSVCLNLCLPVYFSLPSPLPGANADTV